MLTRPPACRRAVHRHILTQQESTWITQDVSARGKGQFWKLQRLSRRNGSSVPGPMESRKRSATRRLTYLSEPTQLSIPHLGTLWGMNRKTNPSQWLWEPPSKQLQNPVEENSWLLPWLPDYLPTWDKDQPPVLELEDNPPSRILEANIAGVEVRRFRTSIRAAPIDEIDVICRVFNMSFKQNLQLGLVSEQEAIATIRHVTKEIRRVTPNKTLELSRCLLLYSATWEGISASKVLQPEDLAQVLSKVLFQLCRQPLDSTVQKLYSEILSAIPDHVVKLKGLTFTLATRFLSSGAIHADSTTPYTLSQTDKPVEHMGMQSFHTSIHFVFTLAKSLACHSPQLAHQFLQKSTENLLATTFKNFKGPIRVLRQMRGSWLNMVASLPFAREDLLVGIWQMMEFRPRADEINRSYIPNLPPVTLQDSCVVLLNYWTRMGESEYLMRVSQKFQASSMELRSTNAAVCLFMMMAEDARYLNSCAADLFRFLRSIQRPRAVYTILKALSNSQLNLRPRIIMNEIEEMSGIDSRFALNMFKLYPALCKNGVSLRLDACPKLLTAMIRDPQVNPCEIWGALKINDKIWRYRSGKRIDSERIATIYKMALEFARAEERPSRVALRNVTNCGQYLTNHGIKVSADFSRIVSHIGIGRPLSEKQRIGSSKLLWILRTVRKREGEEVSEALKRIVSALQSLYMEQRQRRRREANPLRLGPID